MTAFRAHRHRPSPSPRHGADDDAPGTASRSLPATESSFRSLRTVVEAQPARASGVRRTVVEHLSHFRLPAELLDNAALATDELFANAVTHGSPDPGDTVTVSVQGTDHEVRVTVADRSTELPRHRTAGTAEESGRGLSIVAALTDDWGVAPPEPGETGKRVGCGSRWTFGRCCDRFRQFGPPRARRGARRTSGPPLGRCAEDPRRSGGDARGIRVRRGRHDR
ncbi:ATP-binding protein [Streptomyces sp. CWNU-52B]|uniref:ATP-binding protein n=1 Tax=unclassified Streptomyces TaxID=2593676 RepID=UPI0039BFEF3F